MDTLTSGWENAPPIVVAQSIDDPAVPQALRDEDARQRAMGAEGGVGGVFFGGKVYLFADELPGDAATVCTLMHESAGHYGMRGAFGSDFGAMLDRMAVLNSGKVRKAAQRLGYDFEKQADRRLAAEEVLAYMAQDTPELGWVQRALAAIRTWARDKIPGFSKLGLSDAELIRDFILPARDFVERGPGPRGGGPRGGKVASKARPEAPVFSRSPIAEALDRGMNSVRDLKLPGNYVVSDFMDNAGRLGWWHKTVGSMYHLAQKSAPFKAVYDSVQKFLNDVSFYATEAADLAPTLLPKLDALADIKKQPLSAADTKALAAPVFEGTLLWGRDSRGRAKRIADLEAEYGATDVHEKAQILLREGKVEPEVLRMWQGMTLERFEAIINPKFEREILKPGVVFSDAELRQHFSLTDEQIGHYKQFRKAIDKSITDLALTEMLRYGGKQVEGVRDAAMAAETLDDAAMILRDKFFALAAANPARAEKFNESGNEIVRRLDRAKDLMAHGYAPLMRFGHYTLDVVSPSGERLYFNLFESASDRAAAQRKMAEVYPDATISAGTVSDESYRLFAGITPETAELFGDMLGLDADGNSLGDQAFQEYIKLAKSNRDATKRLLKRQGVAGYSEDSTRVLAAFIYSNSRRSASNLHMGAVDKAITEIPKGEGQLADEAVKLRDYIKQPQEEAQALRGMLFAWYLGGSLASAMVNMTQPFVVTGPYLSQFGGAVKAARRMAAASKDAARGRTGETALDEALKRAEEEGTVSPQEIHSLQAQAMGKAQLQSGDGTRYGDAKAKLNNAAAKVALAWGKPFGWAEQFNRRTTFIAAYRTAVEEGIANPAQFATKAVIETQFVYNKGNKPRWARGAFGSVLFTFKQFSVNYLELLYRMGTQGAPGSPERKAGQKAALLAIAMLFLVAGADGLPFVEDIEDLIDGVLQRLGYAWSTKQKKREFLANLIGGTGAEFVLKGISGVPGSPIDVSGRLGMGNLIPGSGLLQKKRDHTNDLAELLGPAGDLAKRMAGTAEAVVGGNVAGITQGLPNAARNIVKGVDMLDTGMYRDDKGRKVVDVDAAEAVAKAFGFQPKVVQKMGEAAFEGQRLKDQYQQAAMEIREAWAKAIFEDNEGGIERAKAALDRWNQRNPELPMKANMPSIISRVKEMRKTKAERVEGASPKAIRGQVRSQLAESGA